jgi:GTPase Era involved in 16S rRNA processing
MTSLLEGTDRLVTRGTDIGARIDGLDDAARAARGRLDDSVVDECAAVVERAAGRLRLSASHTVVAVAGATGSGKSSTFNALTGLELSAVGVRRPTTSWATACVWGREGAAELLDWLGIPPRHQTTRDSMLDSVRRDQQAELDGVVLLDLPDHDSTEVAHHLEVDRLVGLADLVVWVVDPQKYADAAIHERYLKPAVEQQDVLLVVLNHLDTVPEERRKGMLRDLRKLLVADGMRDPRILATSARHGIGMKDLRTAIHRRVEEKQHAALRVEADIRSGALRLEEASGDGPLTVPDVWVSDLERRVAAAAGVTGLVAEVERRARAEARRRMTPPILRGGRGDTAAAEQELDRLGPVDRPAVDGAVRAFVDNVCRDLTPAWADPIRVAATEGLKETDDRLDGELSSLSFKPRLPGWFTSVGLLRVATAVGAVAALLWLIAAVILGSSTTAPLVALGVLTAAAVGSVLVGGRLADRAAAEQTAAVEDECRKVIARVVRTHVVGPVRGELATYARFHRGISAAKA